MKSIQKNFFIVVAILLEIIVLLTKNIIFHMFANELGWFIFEIIQSLFIILLIIYCIYIKQHFYEITKQDIMQLSIVYGVLGLFDYITHFHFMESRCSLFVLGALILHVIIVYLKFINKDKIENS